MKKYIWVIGMVWGRKRFTWVPCKSGGFNFYVDPLDSYEDEGWQFGVYIGLNRWKHCIGFRLVLTGPKGY